VTRTILSPKALDDLEEIGDYIAKDNKEAAHSFVSRLRNRCFSLVDNPQIGRNRAQLRPQLRSVTESNYIIFYRCSPGLVEIVRILNGARDIEKIFEQSE
jgi:toxin ParE1/3/4